jgi:hypothetical protein
MDYMGWTSTLGKGFLCQNVNFSEAGISEGVPVSVQRLQFKETKSSAFSEVDRLSHPRMLSLNLVS